MQFAFAKSQRVPWPTFPDSNCHARQANVLIQINMTNGPLPFGPGLALTGAADLQRSLVPREWPREAQFVPSNILIYLNGEDLGCSSGDIGRG